MKIYAPALALGFTLLCNINFSFPASALPPVTPEPSNAAAESAAGAKASTVVAAPEKAAIEAKADALLHATSDFYAGLKKFNTTMVREKEKSDGSSSSMQFKVEAEKPDKLSIKISGGVERFDGGMAKMNGDKLSLFNPMVGYITSKAAPSYDDLVRDREFQFATGYVLHGQNFLEALLSKNPYEFLLQHYGINGGDLIGEEKIDGVKCDHLHLTSNRISYDVWVEKGPSPWIRRVSSQRNKIKGEGSVLVFNYEHSSAQTRENDFAFTPPSGAKQVNTFFGSLKESETKSQTSGQLNPAAGVSAQPSGNRLLNQAAPQIVLDTLDGGKLDLASLKDKNVVVLDFWATWCPPCRKALPILNSVTKSYAEKGVKFFAVDLREDPAQVRAYLKKQELDVNVALDKDGVAASKYGVNGIPQSVIISKDGIIRVVHIGLSPDLETRLASELDQVLAGKEVAGE